MTDTEQNPPKRPGRGLKILLGCSLALNLVVIGIVAGAFARHDGRPSARAPALSAFGAPYMRALPKAQRREVFEIARQNADQPIPDRAARREMFGDVVAALRSTPFSVEQLETAVARQANITVSLQKASQQAWVQVVKDMTDQERADYASAIEKGLRRGPKKR